MAAKTLRNLASGSGTVTTVAGSPYLSFSSAQTLKVGTTIKTNGGQLFTILEGQGQAYTAKQNAASAESGVAFTTSDTSTTRGRGSSGLIVPWAVHFVYCSFVDDAGNFDYYSYVDTLAPENGVHPYTKDPVIGSYYASQATDTPSLMPDDRLRMLEGIVRGPNGTTFGAPDKRLKDMEGRVYNLEGWANSAGHFGTPPAQGVTDESGSFDQLRQRGDA